MMRHSDVFDFFGLIPLLRDCNGVPPGLDWNLQVAVYINSPFPLAINIDIRSGSAARYIDQGQRLVGNQIDGAS